MTGNNARKLETRQALMRPASSRPNVTSEAQPPTFKNLSDILKTLEPGHRRIILDELDEGITEGSVVALPRKTAPPKIEIHTKRPTTHQDLSRLPH